ncbi:MAG: zinc ribbon domain-containing protein [Candidatus Diapherotrites archaeon]|nr:zinc ribbon domain-containing protein [Candidatus Diapherotrites archaeon]
MSDVLIYALLVLGSGSFGYAITRLALPEVRSWPMDYKMGASVIIGGGVALVSIFIGLFFPYLLYFSLLGIGAVSIQVVKTKSALFTPSEIEVAVPKKYLETRVAKAENVPMNVLYKKLKERKPEAEARIVRAEKPRKGISIPKVQIPFISRPEIEVEEPELLTVVTPKEKRAIKVSKESLPKEKTLKEAVEKKEEIPLVEKPKKGLFGFVKKPKAPKAEKPKPERAEKPKPQKVEKPKEEKRHLSWRERREERMRAVPMAAPPAPGAVAPSPPPAERKRGRERPERHGRRGRPGREAAPAPTFTEAPLPSVGFSEEMPKLSVIGEGEKPLKFGEISDLDAEPTMDNELSIVDLDKGIGKKDLPSIDDMAELDVIGADAGTQKVKTTEKKACKTCGSPLKKAIFCSSCGTQFCPNCAESVNVKENTTEYTCPKCKSKVIVQNK